MRETSIFQGREEEGKEKEGRGRKIRPCENEDGRVRKGN